MKFDDDCTAVVLAQTYNGNRRLTTFGLRYPRVIHEHVLTHCLFARNSASNRAIPVKKLVAQVRDCCWRPAVFFENQAGMAPKSTEVAEREAAAALWANAAEFACDTAERLGEFGVAKEIANAVLRPFQFIDTVLTCLTSGPEWDGPEGFVAQRTSPGAQTQTASLAHAMVRAIEAWPGERCVGLVEGLVWHLPLTTSQERKLGRLAPLISAGRCARWSYGAVSAESDPTGDAIARSRKLLAASPRHLSPFEHVAVLGCASSDLVPSGLGKFRAAGFLQLRHLIQFEAGWAEFGLRPH